MTKNKIPQLSDQIESRTQLQCGKGKRLPHRQNLLGHVRGEYSLIAARREPVEMQALFYIRELPVAGSCLAQWVFLFRGCGLHSGF